MRSSDNSNLSPNPWAGQEPPRRGPPPIGGVTPTPRVAAAHRDVFVIYRPLHACPFCARRLYAPEGVEADGSPRPAPPDLLPDTGEEYICPHVRRTAYEKLLGDAVAQRIDIRETTPTTLGNGTVQVLVAWVELDGVPKPTSAVAAGARDF